MVQFHPFRDVAEEYNYTRVDPGMFNWGRGGGVGESKLWFRKDC